MCICNVFKPETMRNVMSKTKRNTTEMFLYASGRQVELNSAKEGHFLSSPAAV